MNHDYQPNLLLDDDSGHVCEQNAASVRMKLADALRERRQARTRRDYGIADRKFIESTMFALWAMEQTKSTC